MSIIWNHLELKLRIGAKIKLYLSKTVYVLTFCNEELKKWESDKPKKVLAGTSHNLSMGQIVRTLRVEKETITTTQRATKKNFRGEL